MIFYAFAAVNFFPSLVFSLSDAEFRSSQIKSIINSQSTCHVHLVNKDKIRIEGEIKSPVTMDTHNESYLSIPLMRVKPFKCVILLIAKFFKQETKRTNLEYLVKTVHRKFLSNKLSGTKASGFSALVYLVTRPTEKVLKHIREYQAFVLLFRIVVIVRFPKPKSKPHSKNYIVRRFMGSKVSLLEKVHFSKLIKVLRELIDLDAYSGSFCFLEQTPMGLVPVISVGSIRRKGGPCQRS